MIPDAWLPDCRMDRVIFHWTAGTYEPGETERRAYHLLIDGKGQVHPGVPIDRNSEQLKLGYAAHTRNSNTNSIGVSLCGMGGAQHSPYSAGAWPLREEQVDTLVRLLQALGARYGIPVGRRTMLSHAEVQQTLGIPQAAKWDIAVLPSVSDARDARRIGDAIRASVGNVTEDPGKPVIPDPNAPMPAGAMAVVISTDALNTRRTPNGEIIGSLPPGTLVQVIKHSGAWLEIKSPAGYTGWVFGAHLRAVDGPPEPVPTIPDKRRLLVSEIRARLEDLEKLL